MPQLVRNDDPLNAVGQITVDYNQFAPRRNQEKTLAGTGTLSHWTFHHLDIQILADLIRVICLIFHFNRLTSCLIVIVSNPLASLQKVVFYYTA